MEFSYQDMCHDELQTKSQSVTKMFSSLYISVDSPGQDIIVFSIPVIIATKIKLKLIVSLKTCLSIVNFLQ